MICLSKMCFYLGFDKLLKLELLVSSNVGWLLDMCLYLGFNNLLELELLVFPIVEWLLDFFQNLSSKYFKINLGKVFTRLVISKLKNWVNVCKGFLA